VKKDIPVQTVGNALRCEIEGAVHQTSSKDRALARIPVQLISGIHNFDISMPIDIVRELGSTKRKLTKCWSNFPMIVCMQSGL
jgi:hypothetical protein